MRPILSAQGTYNCALAKWLKLLNQYTISDIFSFSEDLRNMSLNESDILVSYDVSSLFTNVPLDETIYILVEKAFKNNWFNVTNKLNISKSDLVELLQVAIKSQLFQFDGRLYEQVDGVVMGSALGPLVANAFLCSIEVLNNSSGRTSYHHAIGGMSMTHSLQCQTFKVQRPSWQL